MLFFYGVLTCFLLTALFFDVTRYIIPNWIVGIVALLYIPFVLAAPDTAVIDWKGGLVAFGILFAGGFVIYVLRVMGGGDIKLLAACGLWVGMKGLLDLVFITALLGGAAAMLLMMGRPTVAWIASRMKHAPRIPRLLLPGEPIPYGVAIVGAMLWMLWLSGKMPAAL